jgi:dimethylamine monooxygenase subunit A
MKIDWRRLFPDADHRFQMLLRPGDTAGFWQPGPSSQELLAERRRWLDHDPGLYLGALPQGRDAITEALGFMAAAAGCGPLADARQAAASLDPDWVVLSGEERDGFPVWGGAVIFPSSWSLPEKLGLPMFAVHAPVPGLEENLGHSIQVFLARMKAGAPWERFNWGLSASPELNQHPARDVPGPGSSATLESTWLRLERQFLARLPATAAILFGIRVSSHPLVEIARQPGAAAGLARALASMDAEVARYKGLVDARQGLVRLLS